MSLQALLFLRLTDAAQQHLQGQRVLPPLRIIMAGEPGAGKSQVRDATVSNNAYQASLPIAYKTPVQPMSCPDFPVSNC